MNRPSIASLLVGMIFGASVMFVYQGNIIDKLRASNYQFSQENSDLMYENQLLSSKLQQSSPKKLIEKIDLEIKAPAGVSQLDVANEIKSKYLNFLIGKELSSLERNPDLPARLIDDKLYVADQETYKLEVNYVVISEKLMISVKVTPVSNTS